MLKAGSLDSHTLHVVRSRLGQIAAVRGSLTASEIYQLLSDWMHSETDIPMIKAAGRIRKLQLKDAWTPRDQSAFEARHTPDFCAKVARYIKLMQKNKSNRI